MRWLYSTASSSHSVGAIYERLRSGHDYNKPSISRWILGHQLQANFRSGDSPLIVSHPALVGILAGRPDLIYQHGELVAPPESRVKGASLVCVPSEEVAEQFRTVGYQPDQILISGLCVEPALVKIAEDAYRRRLLRLESSAELCGGYFSSGAEPDAHVEYLAQAALAVAGKGGKVAVFAIEGGKLAKRVQGLFARNNRSVVLVTTETSIPTELSEATLINYRNRREENTLVSLVFPHMDYFVAPAHERVNWAIGLGLPLIALEPTTGPFAPLNLKLACEAGVGIRSGELGKAAAIHQSLGKLRRQGLLARMSRSGWGRLPIDGFETIAKMLISRFQ